MLNEGNHQPVVLLGADATFRRQGLAGESVVTGGVSLNVILEPLPLPFLFLLHGGHKEQLCFTWYFPP
jgi:hypothetical protein